MKDKKKGKVLHGWDERQIKGNKERKSFHTTKVK